MRFLAKSMCMFLLALCLGCSCGSGGGTDTVAVPDTVADVPTPDRTETPDVSVPDRVVPDRVLPDAAVPDAAVPDVAAETGEKDEQTGDWPLKLTIIHINDLHSHLQGFGPEAEYSSDTTGDDGTVGGVARMATIIKGIKAEAAGDVLIVDAGDFTMGSVFALLSATTGVELKIMDALGVQAAALGNHELDWGPSGAAAIVAAGKQDTSIHILASNIVTDADNPGDDEFEALVEQGAIEKELIIETAGGIKVGLFGLLGKGAADDAPFKAPLTINKKLDEVAAERVESLRAQGANLTVALSHSGVAPGAVKYEDEKLAEKVDGLDVIVSGHTHTALTEKEGDDDTIVVQAGCYGRFVGKLELDVYEDHAEFVAYELITVDDSVQGDLEMQQMVDQFVAEVDGQLQALGMSYGQVLAETEFDVLTLELAESGLGNLITDAIVFAVNQVEGDDTPVTAAFEANGVIRDSILAGKSGKVTVADAFRVLPLGMGPDGFPGYPLVSFYISAAELKDACEAAAAIPNLKGNSFFLQFSGFKFMYDPGGGFFDAVETIYLKEGEAYADESLDFSDANEQLYRVALNSYVAAMMYVLEEISGGLLSVTPKTKEGIVVEDMSTTVLDIDPQTAGLQELKLWQALFQYLASFPDTNDNQIPEIPQKYKEAEGRMIIIQ